MNQQNQRNQPELLEYELEQIKGLGVWEEAKLLAFMSKREAIKGNFDGFITGMMIVEKTLESKLDKEYTAEIDKVRKEMDLKEGEELTNEQRLTLALARLGGLYHHIEKRQPKDIMGII